LFSYYFLCMAQFYLTGVKKIIIIKKKKKNRYGEFGRLHLFEFLRDRLDVY